MLKDRSNIERLLYRALRSVSPRFRAHSELFEQPYTDWVEWNSGLGQAVHLLYSLTLALKPNVIVEIGSARGKSTCAFALACQRNGKGAVFAIDPHTPNDWTDQGVQRSDDFLRLRLEEYGLVGVATILKATSEQAARTWNTPIDLLFIDGDHSYEGVKFDFDAFKQWLTPDALVLFHDSAWNHRAPWESFPAAQHYHSEMGVPRFMEELRGQGYASITLLPEPGLTVLYPRIGGFPFLAGATQEAKASAD